MNVGEKLNENEVDELLSYVQVSKDGCVKYEELINQVLL
jgi:Ca2+-binding EF-hand superfamily protein